MQLLPIHMDDHQKETIHFRSTLLSYSFYTPGPKGSFCGDIPWHWHDEFEFGCVLGGGVLYKTSLSEYVLREGDGIFINSGVLHYLHPLNPTENAQISSHFFDKTFLSGAPGSVFDLKYITPVQETRLLDAYPLYRSCAQSRQFLDQLKEASQISSQGGPFYELRLRSLFSGMWETVYDWALKKRSHNADTVPPDNERIKQLLIFIQSHYSERLSIARIAAQIPISERECYRLFKNSLGISPIDYLNSFRLQKAMELLTSTRQSIVDIAMETGFNSSSYFGKIFKQYYQMTPKQYRTFCQTARHS